MQYDRVQLKLSVKAAMRGARTRPMLMTLLFSVIVSVGTGMVNFVSRLLSGGMGGYSERLWAYILAGYEMDEAMERVLMDFMSRGPGVLFSIAVLGLVMSIIVYLWQSVMGVGYEGYALALVRGEDPDAGKLFCAFPRIGGVLVTRILTGIFVFLWSLLLGVGLAVVIVAMVVIAAVTDMVVLPVLVMIVGVVAYEIGVVWVTMRYALADYALLDQNLSGMDAIRESRRLMQDNVGRAFVLQLSFIGWELLSIALWLTGIAALVIPISIQVAYGRVSDIGGMIASAGMGLLIMLVMFLGGAILSLWLSPYRTGAMAKFYDWAKGAAPKGPAGWSGPTDYNWSTRQFWLANLNTSAIRTASEKHLIPKTPRRGRISAPAFSHHKER